MSEWPDEETDKPLDLPRYAVKCQPAFAATTARETLPRRVSAAELITATDSILNGRFLMDD